MSDAEFERLEDKLDAISYDESGHDRSPQGLARWRRAQSTRARVAVLVGLILAVVAVVLLVTRTGALKPPSCSPHLSGCRESLDGYWIPHWYYAALASAQHVSGAGTAPRTTGTPPTIKQLTAAGATTPEVAEAEKYASSVASSYSTVGGARYSGAGGVGDSGQ